MELFPGMSYQDVMSMPFKEFRALHTIRIKRKQTEQENLERERKKQEEKNERQLMKDRITKGKPM